MKGETCLAAALAFNGVVIVCALFVLCSGASVHAQFSAKVYHDGGTSNEWPGKMIKTSDGNVAMCGYADSVQTGNDQGEWIDGRFIPQIYTIVAKMKPDGETLWKRKFSQDVQAPWQLCAKSIAETKDGGFIVTGWARIAWPVGGMDPYVGRGYTTVFVLRLDKDGNEIWRRFYQPTYVDQFSDLVSSTLTRISAGDVVVRSNGNIVIAGVGEMVGRSSDFQSGVDMNENIYSTCFIKDQVSNSPSSRYLWFLELSEKDTVEFTRCPRK